MVEQLIESEAFIPITTVTKYTSADWIISKLRGSKEDITIIVKETKNNNYRLQFGENGFKHSVLIKDMNIIYSYLKRFGVRLNVQFEPELLLFFTIRGWKRNV